MLLLPVHSLASLCAARLHVLPASTAPHISLADEVRHHAGMLRAQLGVPPGLRS